MKPSEALAKIRAALMAVVDWDGDSETWPHVEISAACNAVYELAKARGSMGTAKERSKPNEVGAFAIIATTKLMHLANDATTDPVAKLQLVASFGILVTELVELPADRGTERSREQQERARKPRKLDETKALFRLACEVAAEWGIADDSPHRGQKMTVAGVVRETGERLFGTDDPSAWPVSERALYDRLREYIKTLESAPKKPRSNG